MMKVKMHTKLDHVRGASIVEKRCCETKQKVCVDNKMVDKET